MLEIRILGSFEALQDGAAIGLGGPKQRAVLAILLAQRGAAVSVDRIVDQLWGEQPPATAVKTVQAYVSNLRRALGPGVVATAGGGYAFTAAPEQVDAARFEMLLADGRAALTADEPARAAELLRLALALWRGPAFGDLAYERFAQHEAARLEELRVGALEECVEADVRMGRHAELVAELERLVREHPLRERLRGQLMLALYRCGRQAEALDIYRQARRALVEELGIEPGPELRELERAILAQDPALDRPRMSGRSPPVAARRRWDGTLIALAGVLLAAVTLIIVRADDRARERVDVIPDSVVVLDAASGRRMADIPVGARPQAIAAGGRSIWVANGADGTVSQIDAAKRRVIATLVPGTAVEGLAAAPNAVWVTDGRRGVAVRLDPEFNAVASKLRIPTRLPFLGSGTPSTATIGEGSVWVASGGAAILRIDARRRRVRARIDVGNSPAGVALGARAVWVSDAVDNTVMRIDPSGAGAVTDTIPLGEGPGGIAADKAGVWVANTLDDTVSRIDPRTRAITHTLAVGGRPVGVAIGAGSVWVANSLGGTVSRIDPHSNRVVDTIEVGHAPYALTVAGDKVWVAVQEGEPRPAPAGGRAMVRVLWEGDTGPTDPALDFDLQRTYATCALLMTYTNRGRSGTAELAPEVARASPAVSADGRVYRFELRDGYRFSPPSNRPVTAAAFKRAMERTLHPDMGAFSAPALLDVVGARAYHAGRSDRLAGVTARGNRLVVRLNRPEPSLPARLAALSFCAVPPNTPIRAEGVDRIPSAGPYYVASHAQGRRLVLRRNPNYPGPRRSRLEEIDITLGVTPERAVAQVESGKADYVRNVPADAQGRLRERYGAGSRAAAAGRQRYFTAPDPAVFGFIFNTRRPLFARVALRRAVNFAIDRRALAQHPRPPLLAARPTDQYIPPGFPGFHDAAIYPLGGPNLDVARRLTDSRYRRAVLYTCNVAACAEQAAILRENLTGIGIDLDVHRFSFTKLFGRLATAGEPFDIATWGWSADFPDPHDFISTQFAAAGSTGARLFDAPALKRRLRVAARLTGKARAAAYAELDHALAARAAPVAAVMSAERTDFFSARIGCQVEHPLYGIDLASLCVRR